MALREWQLNIDQSLGVRLVFDGRGETLSRVLLNKQMRTKTEQRLTVHMDATDVTVIQMGSLLSITDRNDDTLHIFLSAQGWEQLREKLNQRALQAADS